MKIETYGPLKLSVSEKGSFVRIDVSRVRSAEDLMDPLGLRAVMSYLSGSGCKNVVLNLGAAGVVSTQMLEWLARKWLPSASACVQRLSVVTAGEAHKMLAGILDLCSRQVRPPQELRFFTSAQLKSGSVVFDWFSAQASAPDSAVQGLELAVHAYGGVPFVCVDFPFISSIEGYKRALFDKAILEFIRANQGSNLLLNFTASSAFGDELPDWIRETWLEIAADAGVERVLVALQSQVHGSFARALKPAGLERAGVQTQVKYCGETEVFDTGEALDWFKENRAA